MAKLIWSAREPAVLVLVLWPWKQRRILSRSTIATLLYVPWTLLTKMAAMHTGSIVWALLPGRSGIALLLVAGTFVLALRAIFGSTGVRR